MSALTELPCPAWTPDDTERWLTLHALPPDFSWPHRDARPDGSENVQPVIPSYRLHKGYGFWLRTTPYFPGLFEEIHTIFLAARNDEPLPTSEQLAEMLRERRAARGTQQQMFSTPLPQ